MLEPRSGYSSLQTKNNMWVFIFTHITQKKEAIQEDLSKYMNWINLLKMDWPYSLQPKRIKAATKETEV